MSSLTYSQVKISSAARTAFEEEQSRLNEAKQDMMKLMTP